MVSKKLVLWLWITLICPSYQILEEWQDATSFDVQTLVIDSLQLTLSSKLLLDVYSSKGHVLKGYLGWLPHRSNTSYSRCSEEDSLTDSICLKYDKKMELHVTKNNLDDCEVDTMTCHSVQCYNINWKNHINTAMDCFVLGDDLWFGGGETISQRWPLQSDSRAWHAVTTGDPLHHNHGNIVENLWLSSGGFSIYVEHSVPLFVNFNESGNGKFCLSTSSKKHPYHNDYRGYKPELTYSICTAMTIKDVYTYAAHRWIKKPAEVPEEHVFHFPIWSTWARYKRSIDENAILDFAKTIKESDLPASQIEIDDKWESCYGDLEFDSTKFPNPKHMTSELENLGYPTTLWVHPFCNPECKTYNIGREKGFWVKDKQGDPVEVKWWNGMNSALLDTTNKRATKWFIERLKRLQKKYGILSFKFEAGELQWMDTNFVLEDEDANLQPNIYTKEYANLAAEFGGRVEVRVGYETQELPVFVRMFDRFSHWDYTNGLQTLIPTALQLSMLGYHFIIPDMIGGNNYTPNNGSIPNRELYVRWLEANVFLPVLQFSIAPFDYDDEVMQITKKMMELREKHVHYILHLAHQSTRTGDPLVRPLWWIAPDDMEAMSIDSQFLLGDNIMVAPVLEKGAKKRNIYLPEGKWMDIQRGKTYEGSQWLYDYKAPLNFLPYFIRKS
uniref:Putative glucosidase n=1 Tax=Cupiennius salei TaxID=6928 RepID=T1DG65_CUPSA